jgi:general secretion pathway protein N
MKKAFTVGVIFLITYLGFLIATLPATVLLNQFSLPKNVSISGVTGSIWNTKIALVKVENITVQKVQTQLSFWSLFSLTPRTFVTFGDSFIAGPEGEFELLISSEKAELNQVTLLLKANEIAQQLILPLPLSAQGNVELTLANVEIDLTKGNECKAAKGTVFWSKAGVVAFEKNIKLGDFNADVDCENGALAVILSPKNDLGLTFNAYVRNDGSISGNGFLKPTAKFPQVLNDALSFLGKKDSAGRYRLSF